LQIDGPRAEVLENVHDECVLLCEQSEKEVLSAYVFMMPAAGVLTRLDKCPTHSAVEIVPGQTASSGGAKIPPPRK
jgi:hypothetical protein